MGMTVGLVAAALLLIKPGWITDLIWLMIFLIIIALRRQHYSAWKQQEMGTIQCVGKEGQ